MIDKTKRELDQRKSEISSILKKHENELLNISEKNKMKMETMEKMHE